MDKPKKPVDPGPTAVPAESRAYAEANAAWSAWIKEHPEDASETVSEVQEHEASQ